ncbi:DUF2336 domain-containing protein [Pelagibacterium halotolerans]|uniref:DUF2336 domain-containing protein n=1 Tax=Pelagibacterium halotolerans TaxID=531813 RepID=UPI003850916B
MIGFQPYETFQLLIETGGVERANTLLVAACDAFARRPRPMSAEVAQFETLAARLFPTAMPSARAKAAGILASAPGLTPNLETLVFENLGTGLIPHIQKAETISEDVLMRLIDKREIDVIAAIASRPDLSNAVLAKLFPINSRKVYRALAANTALAPRGAYLKALARSAQMDQEVAATLCRRDDFDAALLSEAFFDLPEDGRLAVIGAYAHRRLPQAPMMATFEHISVATEEFTGALMKLFSQNQRPRITRLLAQITGLDDVRCGQIAHDVSGAALFVVLRAFGCTAHDGLKVLIHATSHDEDRSQHLARFARLFEDVPPAAMVYMLSAWRGDVNPFELTKSDYAPFVQPSRRTAERPAAQPRSGGVGDRALETLDKLRSLRAS